MNDWTLPPYRFDDPPGRPPGPGAGGAAPASPPPEPPFRADLKPPPRRGGGGGWVWRTLLAGALLGALTVAVGTAYVWFRYLQHTPELPSREALFAVNRSPGVRFEDRSGQVIASRGPRYGQRVTVNSVPGYVPLAFLAAEDRRFYRHGPIDAYAIGRAAWVNLRTGRTAQGASTLSQQLAKGMFLTPDRTIERKLQEILMAWRLEQVLSKDEVLELYLNRVFFGANTFGVDGAARTYFGKPANRLTLGEAALLASLPKAPSRLALNRDMAGALARSRLVLANMEAEAWITPAEHAAALAEKPKLAPDVSSEEGDYGWVLDYATAEAVRIAGQNAPDLVVRLTIDSRLQKAGGDIVRQAVALGGNHSRASQAALLSLSADGAVRAMVGGTDYIASPFNRAVQARRQPGSTFKPFVYAAALEKGVMPRDVREDAPVRFGDWRPENYGGGYRGPMTVEQALIASTNTIAVKLAQEAGGPAIGALARRFGVTTLPERPDLSVALGAYEVTLLQMTSGFQVFQLGGQRVEPYVIESITSQDGRPIFTRGAMNPQQVYDVGRASMMVRMMKKVVEQGTAKRAAFGWPAAGKTGTSQNWRDAWFVGFTPDFVTGVWVGNDDDRPMNKVVGGDMPAAIWRRFMLAAHQNLAIRDFPWLLPDPEVTPAEDAEAPQAQAAPDPRNGFYETLAAEFDRTVSELEYDAAPEYGPEREAPEEVPY